MKEFGALRAHCVVLVLARHFLNILQHYKTVRHAKVGENAHGQQAQTGGAILGEDGCNVLDSAGSHRPHTLQTY